MSPYGAGRTSFIDRLENISFVVLDSELLQQLDVFLAERFLRMVLLLVLDVAEDGVELRARVGKRAESLLPGEPAGHPALALDERRRSGFDVPRPNPTAPCPAAIQAGYERDRACY